jgi:hypothetical protein
MWSGQPTSLGTKAWPPETVGLGETGEAEKVPSSPYACYHSPPHAPTPQLAGASSPALGLASDAPGPGTVS